MVLHYKPHGHAYLRVLLQCLVLFLLFNLNFEISMCLYNVCKSTCSKSRQIQQVRYINNEFTEGL